MVVEYISVHSNVLLENVIELKNLPANEKARSQPLRSVGTKIIASSASPLHAYASMLTVRRPSLREYEGLLSANCYIMSSNGATIPAGSSIPPLAKCAK